MTNPSIYCPLHNKNPLAPITIIINLLRLPLPTHLLLRGPPMDMARIIVVVELVWQQTPLSIEAAPPLGHPLAALAANIITHRTATATTEKRNVVPGHMAAVITTATSNTQAGTTPTIRYVLLEEDPLKRTIIMAVTRPLVDLVAGLCIITTQSYHRCVCHPQALDPFTILLVTRLVEQYLLPPQLHRLKARAQDTTITTNTATPPRGRGSYFPPSTYHPSVTL